MKIKTAQLHQAAMFASSLGQIKKTLDQQNYPGIEMVLTSFGLKCTYRGEVTIIPVTNFQALVVDDSQD